MSLQKVTGAKQVALNVFKCMHLNGWQHRTKMEKIPVLWTDKVQSKVETYWNNEDFATWSDERINLDQAPVEHYSNDVCSKSSVMAHS